MKINPTISIGKVSGNDEDYMELTIRDEASNISFVKVKVELAEFMKALTGLYDTKCISGEVRGLENVGKIHEYEKAEVFISEAEYKMVTVGVRYEHANEALADWIRENHGREGWFVDGYLGSQSSIAYVEGGKKLRFRYYRYV